MTNTYAIEALLFDFGGTLDANGIAWKERTYGYYRDENLDMAEEAFSSAFYAADDPLVGSLPSDADLSLTVQRLIANLEIELANRGECPDQINVEGQRGERIAARFIAEALATLAQNRLILETLGRRYQLGIVSNFYGNLQAVCAQARMDDLFDVIIDSHRLGIEKPDPAIFHAALKPLGTSPETTLFIGDSLRRDREGARRMGMGFVWIAPAHVQAEQGRNTQCTNDHPSVTKLVDLVDLLS